MKELIAFRKYLTEGVINEEKSIEDEIKRASKIMLTNLISKNPDGWEDNDFKDEYASVVDSGEFEVIGNMGFLVAGLMLDWSQRKYEEGIYKEVDELLNNYDWDDKFKRYRINEENKTEGVISEGVNLDDKLDTLEDFNSWMESDEIVQIFNDIADVENPIRSGDDLISGYGWVHREDEEREEMFDDIYKGYTKKETIKDILRFHFFEVGFGGTEAEEKEYYQFLDNIGDKAEEKYKITFD
jgi:hypothetical protein